ncbi:MAG: hypothetical protein GF334_00900 [Candidatus Altiarchaeales archaeon]|nr:hypothetical protein [Candidatus Altiarchaeales archaeon]
MAEPNLEMYEKLDRTLEKISQRLNLSKTYAGQMAEKMDSVESRTKKLRKQASKYTKELREAQKAGDPKGIASAEKRLQSVTTYLQQVETFTKRAFNPALVKQQVDQGKNLTKVYASVAEEIEQISKLQTKKGGSMPGYMTPKVAKEWAEKTQKQVALDYARGAGAEAEYKAYSEAGEKGRTDQAVGSSTQMLSSIKGAIGSKGGLAGFGDAFKNLKGTKDTFQKMQLAMGLTAKKGMGLVGTIGSLAKAFGMLAKANIIVLIITAVIQLIKKMNEWDKMMKGLNQTFLKMAGPVTLMGSLSEEMRDFSDALYDLKRNLDLGIDAKEAQQVFQGFASAGMSLQGVKRQVGSYGNAIKEAFSMSRQFGVGMEEMGGMISDQMLNLRSSLDEVGNAFDRLSFDASVAGIESKKFYTAVESAASSVRFYGNYLDFASGMMRDFVQTGTMGFKDAADQVTKITGALSKMDFTQRMKAVGVLGRDFIKKLIEGEAESLNKLAETATGAERERYLSERDRLLGVAQRGIPQEMAMILPRLTKDIRKMMVQGMSGMDIFDPRQVAGVQKKLEGVLGIDFSAFEKEWNSIEEAITAVNSILTRSEGSVSSLFQKNSSAAREAGRIMEKYEGNVDGMTKAMTEFLQGKVGGEDLQMFLNLLKKSPEAAKMFVSGGKAALRDSKKVQGAILTDFQKISEKTAEMTEGKLDQLVKETTPLEKMFKISKEGIDYAMASTNLTEEVAGATFDIAKSSKGILSGIQNIIRILGSIPGIGGQPEKFRKSDDYTKLQAEYARLEAARAMKDADLAKEIQSRIDKIEKKWEDASVEFSSAAKKGKDMFIESGRKIDSYTRREEELTKERRKLASQIRAERDEAEKASLEADKRKLDVEHANIIGQRLALERKTKSFMSSKGLEGVPGAQSQHVTAATRKGIPAPKALDLLVTKTGVLPFTVQAGERIVPKEEMGAGVRFPKGQLTDSRTGLVPGGGMTQTTRVGDIHVHVQGEAKNVEALFRNNGPVEQSILRVLDREKRG